MPKELSLFSNRSSQESGGGSQSTPSAKEYTARPPDCAGIRVFAEMLHGGQIPSTVSGSEIARQVIGLQIVPEFLKIHFSVRRARNLEIVMIMS